MPKNTNPKPTTTTRYRDAKTGQYTTEEDAKKHPNTTVKEIDKVTSNKPKKKKK